MKKSTKTLLAGAAMAGLMTGLVARTYAAQNLPAKGNSGWGQLEAKGDKDKATCKAHGGTCGAQHECKGKNECKGQGGCKSGDNGCKGKNSCKGHGGCATKGE